MKILYVLPLNYALHSPHFRSRFEKMPSNYDFHILVTGDASADGEEFFNVKLHVLSPPAKWTRLRKICKSTAMVVRAIRLARREKVDVIICYDPLTLGIAGMLAKVFSGAKLVIEINGHIRDAMAAQMSGVKVHWLKKKLFNLVGAMTLRAADCVKILNEEQREEWIDVLAEKAVVMFHDYVPIQHFSPSKVDDNYLFCLGFPFYNKGVDVLIEAFSMIQAEFPEYRLMIMGHCREPELSRWKARAEAIDNVEFRKPVPYDEVGSYISSCSVLVTPSRSEGMGRVFIEAMAAAKPCVGTRVGGIPNVIVDGETGLLVEPANAKDLADKLRMLLADAGLRSRMGEAGRRRVETVLSEEKYAECFRRMIDDVLPGSSVKGGIQFNGFRGGIE